MPTWTVEHADCLDFLRSLPADSVDLVLGSPPYEQARLYLEGGVNLGVARKTEAWVSWMVDVFQAAQQACRGLVAFVVAGQTKNYRWSAGPALLAADLHRAGFNLRNPPIFSRVGIPGSGGPDWLRGDYEWIICTSRPGKLPWSDNTAAGHPPKWTLGGEMSNRSVDGSRKNAHGVDTSRPIGTRPGGDKGKKGQSEKETYRAKLRTKGGSPKDGLCEKGQERFGKGRRITSGHVNGDTPNDDTYDPPVLANPGNIIHLNVGGGVMGSKLCHENEAPFPEKLAEFFVRSFCPPGGLVVDPYSGSGTTGAVSVRNGRRFAGCDLRQSQVDLSRRRISGETPDLFESAAAALL